MAVLSVAVAAAVGVRWRQAHRAALPKTPSGAQNPPVEAPGYPDPPGIILHSSDSPASWHGIKINARRLEAIHAHDHPNWATTFEGKTYHIGYHYVIVPDGTIEKGRPDHCPGAHARRYNDWLGICVIGAFSKHNNPRWWPQRPTPKQVASIISLCERLMSEYHIPPENVKRHIDVNQTWCPGDRFPYEEILVSLRQYADAHPETRSDPRHLALVPVRVTDPPGRHRRQVKQ